MTAPQDDKSNGKGSSAEREMETIRKRFAHAQEQDRDNHANYKQDMLFSCSADQWTEEVRAARGRDRVALTFNRLNGIIKQIVGDYRQNKLCVKVRPAAGEASEEVAETLAGLIRNIEAVSNADTAYANALECALRGGFGYFRVLTHYAYDDVFEKDLLIRPVVNPLTVHFDPNAVLPTREDAEYAFISELISREDFKKQYPKARPVGVDSSDTGDMMPWRTREMVRLAEYFEKESYAARLALFDNGITLEIKDDSQIYAMEGLGVRLVKEREAERTRMLWKKISGVEVLEREVLPIRYIPIIPVIGEEVNVEGRSLTRSAIYYAKDAQRQYNYMKSTAVEMTALAPKAPWLGTRTHFEGYEEQWQRVNVAPAPYLVYNHDPEAGGPPQRIAPTPQPIGEVSMALGAADDIKATTGIFDASLGAQSNETSGKAILARAHQGSLATTIFHDNLSKAIEYCGRILIDWIPSTYDTERVVRVLDLEGESRSETVNQRRYAPLTGVTTILNSLTVGKYDVVVTAGPNFASQRMEAMDGMIKLLQTAPQIWPVAGDLIVKNLDWKGSEEIAERIKRAMPPEIVTDPESPEGQQLAAQKANQPPPTPPEVQAQAAQAERQQMEFQQKMELERQKFAFEQQQAIVRNEIEARKIEAQTGADMEKHRLKLAAESEAELRKHYMKLATDAEEKQRREAALAVPIAASQPPITVQFNAEDSLGRVAETITGIAQQAAQATQAVVEIAAAQAQTVQQLATEVAQQGQMVGSAMQQNALAMQEVAVAIQEQNKIAKAPRIARRNSEGKIVAAEIELEA